MANKMTYQTRKELARSEAIDWQYTIGQTDMYMSELAAWNAYFRKLGKRYGLLREFEENGII